jgi:hypothetical protein
VEKKQTGSEDFPPLIVRCGVKPREKIGRDRINMDGDWNASRFMILVVEFHGKKAGWKG